MPDRLFAASVFLMLWTCALYGGEKTIQRTVEFRDGSIVQLPVVDEPWPVTILRPNGQITETSLRPSQLQSVSLTLDDSFEKKREMLSAVQLLGSPRFALRERGRQLLLKMGPAIRPDLEACLKLTTDVEMKVRLHTLIESWPDDQKAAGLHIPFDRIETKDLSWGFFTKPDIRVVFNGSTHHLKRSQVSRILATPPKQRQASWQATQGKGFRRVPLEEFPADCVEEGFELDPKGRRLQVGEKVEKMFVSKGFVLSTSVRDSFVAVNDFPVAGKSQGFSVATKKPRWEGQITVQFVRPDQESFPAGVTYFGCWMASVVPGGTTMIAYNLQGHELGRITTQGQNSEFMGVWSPIPIHKIVIVPNEELDRDVTLDDFIFLPSITAQPAHPSHFTVYLQQGDIILCKDVTMAADQVEMHGMPASLPNLKLAAEQVERINWPRSSTTQHKPADGIFAQLRDGSIVFVKATKNDDVPRFPRLPDLLKTRTVLAGLWSTMYGRLLPPSKLAGPIIWQPDEQTWNHLSYLRFLEAIVLWKLDDETFGASGYYELPPLWLTAPGQPETGRWHVRTVQGEDLVLAPSAIPSGQLSQRINFPWRGQELGIAANELVAVYRTSPTK